MAGKRGRIPAGLSGVTGGAVRGESQSNVVRAGSLFKVCRMAGSAIRGRSGIPRRVAVNTGNSRVPAGQRKCRGIVVEDQIAITVRVAG